MILVQQTDSTFNLRKQKECSGILEKAFQGGRRSEGAGGRANDQLKSYRLQYKALNHALASGIDCIYSRRLRQILRSTKKHRGSSLKEVSKEGKTKSAPMTLVLVKAMKV